MANDIVAKNYSISKMQKRKENFKQEVTSNLPSNKFTNALALLVYSKGGGLAGFRHATSVASIKRSFEDRIIVAARRGAVANASMQLRRSSFAPFRSGRIYKAKRPLRKQLTLFPSPTWYWPLRYFTVMFNNSQTVRWRKPL